MARGSIGTQVTEYIHRSMEAALREVEGADAAVERDSGEGLNSLIGDEQAANLAELMHTADLSYRDGVIVQLAYKLLDPETDPCTRPEGARTVAQRLGEFFQAHYIPFVRDAYQNIAKNTANMCRENNMAFDRFLNWMSDASTDQLQACFDYACREVAKTSRPIRPMPELDVSRLTFARVVGLFMDLLSQPSGGTYEQYIVASLVDAQVSENTPTLHVVTGNINASDESSGSAADVRVVAGTAVVEAYEVTANEWRSKLAAAAGKARRHDLSRIQIVASVSDDYQSVAGEILQREDGVDITVIDLRSFVVHVCAHLRKTFRAQALRTLHEYLSRYQNDIGRVNAYVELLNRHHLTTSGGGE